MTQHDDIAEQDRLRREYEARTDKARAQGDGVVTTPVEIVDFLMEKKLNDVKLQIQLHKVIWDPQKRGV